MRRAEHAMGLHVAAKSAGTPVRRVPPVTQEVEARSEPTPQTSADNVSDSRRSEAPVPHPRTAVVKSGAIALLDVPNITHADRPERGFTQSLELNPLALRGLVAHIADKPLLGALAYIHEPYANAANGAVGMFAPLVKLYETCGWEPRIGEQGKDVDPALLVDLLTLVPERARAAQLCELELIVISADVDYEPALRALHSQRQFLLGGARLVVRRMCWFSTMNVDVRNSYGSRFTALDSYRALLETSVAVRNAIRQKSTI